MKRCLLSSLSFLALTLSAQAQKGDNKEHTNMNDIVPKELIPAAPVLKVEDAIKAFTIQEGFTIEPVAAEPLVERPVALTFDAKGRMWVCEMVGYMQNVDGTNEETPMGRIVILEDTDGDGEIDKRTVFKEKLLLPRTVALVPGGVLIGDQEQLYFQAREGDQAVGEMKVVDPKYAQGANVEHKPNGMVTMMDNWMYNAKGTFRYQWKEGKLIKEPTAFRGQWGITQDNWGRIFHNSNSTLLEGDRFLPNLLSGNSKIKLKSRNAVKVGTNRVYPGRVTPGLNRAYISTLNGYSSNTIDPKTFKLNYATSACGPVIYRGTNFPTRFQGMAFVAGSGSQLVKAISVERQDGTIKGSHPYGESEFLTSTDERFRPVNLYTAPDGSLYILDYYHGIIQHKTYMTTYLRRQTLSRGLEAPGVGHGRIYRVRAVDRPITAVPDLTAMNQGELVAVLKSPNGTHRDLAQKRLVEQGDQSVAKALRQLLQEEGESFTKAHALWTLEGLGSLKVSDIETLLTTSNSDLLGNALYASLSLNSEERAELVGKIASLKNDSDTSPYKARVLASIPKTEAQEALVQLLLSEKEKPQTSFVMAAALSGLSENAKLFKDINNERFKNKHFDELVDASIQEEKKAVKIEDLIAGDHLSSYQRGKALYMGRAACIGCHGADGAGLPNLGPTLDQSNWVTDAPEDLAKVLLYGLQGPIKVSGKDFVPQAFMPGLAQNPTINDQDLADLMTFLRHGWSNRASQVKKDEVSKIRTDNKGQGMMKAADFPDKL